MTRLPRGVVLLLVVTLASAWLAACSSLQPTALPSASSPAEPAPVQPVETIVPAQATPSPPIPDDPLAAKLAGLDLEAFFEASWRELRLRDPEGLVADGLAEQYGLQGAELTNISDSYVRETYDMVETVLVMLRRYNRDGLTPEQQVSYDVYEWYLEDQVRGREFLYNDYPATFWPITAVHEWTLQFFTDLHPLASRQDAEDYVARLGQVGPKFEQLIEGLRLREEAGIVAPRFAIQWGLSGVRGMAASGAASTPYYRTLADKLGSLEGLDSAERAKLLEAAAKAIEESVLPAYRALAEAMERQLSVAPTDEGLWQFATGEAYYDYLLRHFTTTDLTVEEIHELGKQELDRVHAEMRAVFDQLGYPQDAGLPELFDRVAQDGGSVSGDAVIETYEALIEQASANLDGVFDIRPKAEVVVVKSPIKGMYVSASFDGSRPGAFHAGPGNTTEAYYAMPTLAYHEAVPGHHFQIALAQESDLPSFRNALTFLGYAEGWALYAERLAYELGWYADDPHGDLGRLQAEAFRAARLVVDTGIHAQGWTWDEALDFFVENTGYEPGDSVDPELQIARYIVWPGQATSYQIGMIKMLELRQRAMDALGDGFDLKEFHRVVLSSGSMPLEILDRVVDDYIASKTNP